MKVVTLAHQHMGTILNPSQELSDKGALANPRLTPDQDYPSTGGIEVINEPAK